MHIRRAIAADFPALWPIFEAVVVTEDTYAFAPDSNRDEAHEYFFGPGVTSWIAETDGHIAGMYKLVANRRGLGSHVANASFMVHPAAHRAGTGKAMGIHCLKEAKRAGFLAIQFNYVVSTNVAAVALWKSLGFSIVGTLPRAFKHGKLGYVDALVMHRFLDDIEV